jgi:putative transposase
MGKKAFTNEQIVRILEEGERTEEIRAEFCRRQNISEATYYAWRKKFQGMQIQDVRCLKELEKENARLKKLLAEAVLAQEALQEVVKKL